VDQLGAVELPRITVETVDGLLWTQDFELAEPGKLPLGHRVFSGNGGRLATDMAYSGAQSWVIEDLHEYTNGLRTIAIPVIPGCTYRAEAYYTWTGSSAGAFYMDFLDENMKRVKRTHHMV
jgi:hypothetical protein